MIKFTVTVFTKSRHNRLISLSPTTFKIYTTRPAYKGQANTSAIRLLAQHLKIPPSRLIITHGVTAKHKLIQLLP